MATKTYFLSNNVGAVSFWRVLDEAAQAAATLNDGWVVSTGATLHSEMQVNTTRAAATFLDTVPPSGVLNTGLKDAFQTPATLNGSFAATNWDCHFVVQAVANGGAQDGRVRFRLIKANEDGSSATEITSAQQLAGIVLNVAVGADSDSALATFAPGAFTVTNQHLFIQVAWERTGAGGMTTADVRFRTGSSSTVGTRFVTSDFTAAGAGPTVGELVVAAHNPSPVLPWGAHRVIASGPKQGKV